MNVKHVVLTALALLAFAPTAAAGGGRTFEIELTGEAEVPDGDPDGTGTAIITVQPGQMRLCWFIEVENISPSTAAHVHRGDEGVAGPVVVPLSAPTDGDSEGCTQVDRGLLVEIVSRPARFYVNVHNAEYPAGAVRGQLK